MAQAIHALEPASAVDILGYHTGALLATEIAASHPELVRRLVLIGIPFFTGDEKEVWRAKLVHKTRLTEQFDQFRGRWDYFVSSRFQEVSLERAFDAFVDELKCYPREWWAHRALFDYEPASRLARVACETLIINPASPLSDASARAAAVIPLARLEAMPELKGAVFDLGPDRLAQVMNAFLQKPVQRKEEQ
jgi:pimeloyl-ACP methyl ester carboxylesterase